MTPQELKNSILQLAIQGRLVEQRLEEGTGEELYQKIQKEKEALIKTGKIKKTNNLPKITEDEIPFDIPESWKWTKLGAIVSVFGGKRIPAGRRLTTDNTGHVYIRVSDMKNGSVLTGNLMYVPNDIYPLISKYTINKEDVYITVAGTIGAVGKIPPALDGANLTENADKLVFSIIDQNWFVKCLESPFIQNQIADATTKVGQPKLAIKRIQELLVPVPPLSEQTRIVAKIKELMPLVNRYEEAWNRLEELNKRFPTDLQKSILHYAVQGKLVEQRTEEGTGEKLFQAIQKEKQKYIKEGIIRKEKPLPKITEDNAPFEIPESWKWAHIGELFQHNTGKALNSSDKMGTPLEYITTSNVYWNRFELSNLKTMLFSDAEAEKCTIKKGDLLVLEGGDIGRAAIWNYEYPMRIQNHIHRLRPYDKVSIEFFYYLFFLFKNSGLINGKGIGIKGLSAKVLHSLIVPLPPLAEQKRIVAKIEELLPLCGNLQ